jgi:predicted esterase
MQRSIIPVIMFLCSLVLRMKRLGTPLSCSVLLLIATLPELANAASVSDFADFSLLGANGAVLLPGRLYVPPEAAADPTTLRPFILFLHGSGEEGTNNVAQINGNIDNLLAEAKRRGAYLYAPQSTSNWSSLTLTNRVMTMVDRALGQDDVDPNHLYITGLSNGGGGVWNMLIRYPKRFAAAIPISGISPAVPVIPANLLNTPIWAFHARDDSIVSVATTRSVINTILAGASEPLPTYPAAGNTSDFFVSNPNLASHRILENLVQQQPDAKQFFLTSPKLDLLYYELAAGGHAIWPAVYSTPPVYDWLFSHSLAVPEPATVILLPFGALLLVAMLRARRFLKPAIPSTGS